ncbi:MAG: DUF4388 domain-containing protein [Candidatus Obscuribacterales bacterium]|nr:DUF4388 domain-containing protein [Candidatus Obscuribacterales bacterium]
MFGAKIILSNQAWISTPYMHAATDLNTYFGSVGWLVDRANPTGKVLGSVWLIKSQIAICCTHVLIPYFDTPEALGVELPQVGRKFSVSEILPHSYFDPWLVKRTYQQAPLFPNHKLAVEKNNLSALLLNANPPPLEKSVADRVARALARNMPEEESTLAGSATRVQITSILQTLLSNRNQGTLTLFDSRNYPVARFFLKDNQVTHIRFIHLRNEDALYKLLTSISDEESFQFTFTYDFEPEWTKGFAAIEKSTTGLLMDAYSRLESYTQTMEEFKSLSVVISQAVPNLNLEPMTPDMRPAVACTWNHLRHGIPLQRLLRACNFDGATIMYSVKFLKETGQINLTEAAPPDHMDLSKLEVANNCSLDRGTPISSISIDPDTRLPVLETGFILDFFPEIGDGHYVHSLGLPPSAAGSPLIANGEVVGIHCGILTEGVDAYAEWIHPSLAIGADHVYHCLDISPLKKTNEVIATVAAHNVGERLSEKAKKELKEEQTSSDLEPVPTGPILPPHAPDMTSGWSRTSLAQEEYAAREAAHAASSPADQGPNSDNHKDSNRRAEDRLRSMEEVKPTSVSSDELVDTGNFQRKKPTGFFTAIGAMFKGKGGGLENDKIEISLLRQGLDSDKFDKVPHTSIVRSGDLVRVRLRLLANSYAAVLLKTSTGGEPVRLVYPESPTHEDQLIKGQALDVPQHFTEASSLGRKKAFNGIPVGSASGADSVMVITGNQPMVVRLFELGVDRVFSYVTKSLNGETAGRFYVNRFEIQKAEVDTSESPNMLSICVFQLRHTD